MPNNDAVQRIVEAMSIPLPRPDPRGPVISYGAPRQDFRDIGPDGLEVVRGVQPPPSQPLPTQYGFSEHALAALRMLFEGTRFREEMTRAGERDPTGYYDKK